jgi:3-hydroxyacyl-CoA dehydrogenase
LQQTRHADSLACKFISVNTLMSEVVEYQVEGPIAIVRVNNPPVSALSQAVRQGILAHIEIADADDTIKVIVLTASGRTFIAGADIREFGKPTQPPGLGAVVDRIEQCSKPVVAVLHGTTLGGGLEISLGAHYRIALPGARWGFPEVAIGLIPGAGGTQRLPRLTGVKIALDIMTSGKQLSAERALECGVIDVIIDKEPTDAGLDYARHIMSKNLPVRRIGEMKMENDNEARQAMAQCREQLQRKVAGQFSPFKVVDAVEACLEQEFRQGLQTEREIFTQCMDSPQRKGMIHAFFSERAVTKIPEAKQASPREISQLGVIGGGTMGTGITTAALMAGYSVQLIERDDASLQKARNTIAGNLEGGVKRGKFSAEKRQHWLEDQLACSTDFDTLSQSDLIIEAVFEELPVKQEIFRKLDNVARPDAILATNTSYLDVNLIAGVTRRPESVIGLHFFSPAHVMRLLEVVVADKTQVDIVVSAFALAKKLGKVPVRAGVCEGFIGNRVMSAFRKQADYMMEDGASPFEIDAAVRQFGFAMGPFQVLDLAGQDIGWASRKRLMPTMDSRERYVDVADRICEQGWFGRKTGKGFYIYSKENPAGVPNPEILPMVVSARASKGIAPRSFSAEEIANRYLCAMINEAAKVVKEGIALRPLDIDVTLVHGYGFPRYRGGPMKYADMRGLDNVLADIRVYAEEDAYFWKPAELLVELVEQSRDFDSLNQ